MSTELKPIPLVVQPSNRDRTTTKDAKLINCVVEKQPDGRVCVMKRPGFTYLGTLINSTLNGLTDEGGFIFAVFRGGAIPGTKLYSVSTVSTPASTYLSDLYDTSSTWYFSLNMASPRQMLLVSQNGIDAYWINLNTLAVTFMAGWVPTLPGYGVLGPPVYLDGITYVLTGDGRIWNSNVNDVSAGGWNALNFIQARSDADLPIAIQKQLVYIVCFKNYSIEIFYNANRPTGSPLGRNDSAKNTNVGLLDVRTLVRVNEDLLWVAATRSGGTSIAMMRGLSVQIISTPAIDRLLADNWNGLGTVRAFGVKLDGHDLYVLTIGSSPITLVYDITSGEWYQWSDAVGNAFDYFGAVTRRSSYGYTQGPTVFSATGGQVFAVGFNSYKDVTSSGSSVFPAQIRTPIWDQGVRVKKFCNKLEIIGDAQSVGSVSVSVSDDDYQTWSTPRAVNMSDGVATLINCGTFRRRSWDLVHQADAPFRVENLVAHVQMGSA